MEGGKGGAGIGDLGADTLRDVLSKLNIADALRASAVCRQWKSISQSLNHVKLVQTSPFRPYCLRIREDCRELELYGLDGNMRLPLDFLAVKYDMLALLACGGGLLLLRADLGVLVVCNPITRESAELPPLEPPLCFSNPRLFPWLQHPLSSFNSSPMLTLFQDIRDSCLCNQDDKEFQRPTISVILPSDNHRRAAKILLSGYKDERVGIAGSTYDFRTRVYDFSTNVWEETGQLPVRDFRSTDGVYFRRHVYTVIGMWQKSAVIIYDCESRIWRDLEAGVPSSVMHPHLVQRGDALLLVGACNLRNGQPEQNIFALTEAPSFSIRVWQLSECQTKWDELARMPQHIYRNFVRNCTAWFWFECIGRGDLLYFAEKSGGIPELAYDFATDQWQIVPKMPDNCSGIPYLKQLFLYHPSLQGL